MATLSFILWNVSPEIVKLGSFSLRWYGLLFALGFLISQQVLYYVYRKEGKPEKDIDTLTIYMVVATIIGARFGHILFYQPEIMWEDPLSIFLPFEFKPFRFTGLQGLASHGAAIAILFALWLYSRKRKPGQNYLQVLDRIVILIALTGALIRMGNYFNSEIIGQSTNKPWGVVFTGHLTEAIEDERRDTDGIVESIRYVKSEVPPSDNGRVPLTVYILFKANATEVQINTLLNKVHYTMAERLGEFFDESGATLDYQLDKPNAQGYVAKINTTAIARHPTQLYEAFSYLILFIILWLIWTKYKQNLVPGRIFGIFLIGCFGMRFILEYFKENQEDFEAALPLNMGQILSIPLVVAGIIILILSFRKKEGQIS